MHTEAPWKEMCWMKARALEGRQQVKKDIENGCETASDQ